MNMSFPPRTWTRPLWHWWYRELRIARRESDKSLMDAVIFGIGFTRVTADGVNHVSYNDIIADTILAHLPRRSS